VKSIKPWLKNEIDRCRICGNVVQVLNGGQGQLSCCGQPTEILSDDANGREEGYTFEELKDN